MRTKRISYIKAAAAALLCLLLAVFCLPRADWTGRAETGGTVTVHFYNAAGYACDAGYEWGAYYWIDRADTTASSGEDAEFFNAQSPAVKGKLYSLSLTANDVASLKSGKELGLIMVWMKSENGRLVPDWTKKDVNTDRKFKVEFDANNNSDVYVLAGDKTNYFSLADAKTAFERIESAVFDGYGDIKLQTTGTLTASTKAKLSKTTFTDGSTVKETVADNLSLTASGKQGRLTVPGLNESTFDMHAFYELNVDGYAYSVAVDKTRLYISPYFKQNYEPSYYGTDGSRAKYGALYTPAGTVFRVWAPVSYRVRVNLYKTGDKLDSSIYQNPVDMEKKEKGVWEAKVDGDLNGVYYTYSFYTDNTVIESIDVNAYTAGINGDRGMVVDLEAASPEGWAEDLVKANAIRTKQVENPEPIIWELHVRDFSVHPDSGIKYKGKYLAFTEENTTLKGDSTVKTGINYLKDLGVTYVHLLPVYDFDKVDESRMGDPSYTGKFNWGYDPKNYNVPEGSYSTDPYNGEARVLEFKEMVQGLHDAGIGVIMDVVYNHTYSLDSPLNRTVPGYYYRQNITKETGSFNYPSFQTDMLGNYVYADNTGCGNETASERKMYNWYMRNSVLHWAEDYHIDGFRFDLMAIHNIGTINDIRTDLDNSFGGAGRGILMYGEPWTATGGTAIVGDEGDPSTWSANNSEGNVRAMYEGVRIFNDRIRNGIKGGNDENGGYLPGGYITGKPEEAGTVLNAIQGNISNQFAPGKAMNYISAHDNYTLNDHILACIMHHDDRTAAVYTMGNTTADKIYKTAATLVLTSKGTPFMTSGEEFARTKFGNHNSYDSGDKVNALDYARTLVKNDIYEYYKGLIALRKSFSPFRCENGGAAMEAANYDNGGIIMYKYTGGAKAGDAFTKVAVVVNPFGADYTCRDSAFNGWYRIGNGAAIDLNATAKVGASFTVPARSAVILAVR